MHYIISLHIKIFIELYYNKYQRRLEEKICIIPNTAVIVINNIVAVLESPPAAN